MLEHYKYRCRFLKRNGPFQPGVSKAILIFGCRKWPQGIPSCGHAPSQCGSSITKCMTWVTSPTGTQEGSIGFKWQKDKIFPLILKFIIWINKKQGKSWKSIWLENAQKNSLLGLNLLKLDFTMSWGREFSKSFPSNSSKILRKPGKNAMQSFPYGYYYSL